MVVVVAGHPLEDVGGVDEVLVFVEPHEGVGGDGFVGVFDEETADDGSAEEVEPDVDELSVGFGGLLQWLPTAHAVVSQRCGVADS